MAIAEMSTRRFAHDERVYQHLALDQKPFQSGITPSQVIHPDRRIDKDHGLFTCGSDGRGEATFHFHAEPPGVSRYPARSRLATRGARETFFPPRP
jgi:hypothetical protein